MSTLRAALLNPTAVILVGVAVVTLIPPLAVEVSRRLDRSQRASLSAPTALPEQAGDSKASTWSVRMLGGTRVLLIPIDEATDEWRFLFPLYLPGPAGQTEMVRTLPTRGENVDADWVFEVKSDEARTIDCVIEKVRSDNVMTERRSLELATDWRPCSVRLTKEDLAGETRLTLLVGASALPFQVRTVGWKPIGAE